MHSSLALAPLLAWALASSAYAQQPAVAAPLCGTRSGPRVEYLQNLTRQYHPAALAPAAQRDSIIVGFLFDSTCQVVRHAVGRYGPDTTGTVSSELARLFPGLRTPDFRRVGGYSREPFEPGHLIIVWAVLKRA
jgi:hypothetical protein